MARKRFTIRLPSECVDWLDRKVANGVFLSRSQAIEVLILETMKPTGLVSLMADSEKTSKLHRENASRRVREGWTVRFSFQDGGPVVQLVNPS